GRLDRSIIPAAPSCRYRSAHRLAVVALTWNRSAARRSGQPSSTTHWASFKRPRSVKVALAWGTKTSGVSTGLVVAPHSPGGPHHSRSFDRVPSPTSVGSTTSDRPEPADQADQAD